VIHIRNGVAIHGGVGTLPPDQMTAEMEAAYRETLAASLGAGRAALDEGGHALDAVQAAIEVMEDSPLFNAGRGSNLDERGWATMDASVMSGETLEAGAVAGVTDVRNPIALARLVLGASPHLMLIGAGAEAFARRQGVEVTPNEWFRTERRERQLAEAKARDSSRPAEVLGDTVARDKAGTVGAVALDAEGRLAAGTSTGGMANKTWGRVGDSPIIGAGSYAGARCAVSCTGWGEYFIRNAAAYDVHARMAYGGRRLSEAAHEVIFDTLHTQIPESGGLVAIDAEGHVELCFSTPGMYRGWVDEHGDIQLRIARDD
jgi:L-asparaginase / beta-aspartyl-peptidase